MMSRTADAGRGAKLRVIKAVEALDSRWRATRCGIRFVRHGPLLFRPDSGDLCHRNNGGCAQWCVWVDEKHPMTQTWINHRNVSSLPFMPVAAIKIVL